MKTGRAVLSSGSACRSTTKRASILAVAFVALWPWTMACSRGAGNEAAGRAAAETTAPSARLPRLLDLGATKCIPCKMMAPILADLKKDYRGKLEVEFIDVWENPTAGQQYGIRMIPTQIFFDASGKELYRHEGFFSREDILLTWKRLGVNLEGARPVPEIIRETPAATDGRPKDTVCFLCEKDIDPRTRVVVRSPSGGLTRLCSPHCYFILESCLLDKGSMADVTVSDYATGGSLALGTAHFLRAPDAAGRSVIRAFATAETAGAERKRAGGRVLGLEALREKEYEVRCGFCDRVMYLEDNGSVVEVKGGPRTHGCCPHCALGVAARLKKDIVVKCKDPVSGDSIRIETSDGSIRSINPSSAVAWFGQKRKPDGTWGSAGCFHQWNFTSVDNLKKWIDAHPMETGRLITIERALADKMALDQDKIAKACKIGECP